jgi:cytochrome c biogenesis protein CcdA
VIGLLMLDIIKLNTSNGNILQKLADMVKVGNTWGALLLGMIFALAFCPYSGVLYFGMLIPMVMANTSGLLLLPVFAVSTGLPVVILAYLLAFSIGSMGRFYINMKIFEVWFRRIVAVIFILTGIYFVSLFYF